MTDPLELSEDENLSVARLIPKDFDKFTKTLQVEELIPLINEVRTEDPVGTIRRNHADDTAFLTVAGWSWVDILGGFTSTTAPPDPRNWPVIFTASEES